jgi:hypothetical protein
MGRMTWSRRDRLRSVKHAALPLERTMKILRQPQDAKGRTLQATFSTAAGARETVTLGGAKLTTTLNNVALAPTYGQPRCLRVAI